MYETKRNKRIDKMISDIKNSDNYKWWYINGVHENRTHEQVKKEIRAQVERMALLKKQVVRLRLLKRDEAYLPSFVNRFIGIPEKNHSQKKTDETPKKK